MNKINFFLQGFGFDNLTEFKISAFGYMLCGRVLAVSLGVGVANTFLMQYLGIPLIVFSAFIILNILEFITGLIVAKRKGVKVESRKMGRMFLKVGTYITILFMLQSFKMGLNFPELMDFELDPFELLYWAFLAGIIYQLFKSLLENLDSLGYREAGGVLGYITRRFGNKFENTDDTDGSKC